MIYPLPREGLPHFRHHPWSGSCAPCPSRLSDRCDPPASPGGSRCMIVHLLYRACRLLSFAAYEWLSFRICHYPCTLSGPTTQEGFTRQPIVGTMAHDPLTGPQFTNVFVITLAMMYLYLLPYPNSPAIIEYSSVVHGRAWNLHMSVSLTLAGLGQLSAMSRSDNASVGMQCNCFKILGR